jgi:hypothetical protein
MAMGTPGRERQAQWASITSTPRGTAVSDDVRTGRPHTGQIAPPSPSVQPARSCHPEAPHARSSGAAVPSPRDTSRTARHARVRRSTTTEASDVLHSVFPGDVSGHRLVVRQCLGPVNRASPDRASRLPLWRCFGGRNGGL